MYDVVMGVHDFLLCLKVDMVTSKSHSVQIHLCCLCVLLKLFEACCNCGVECCIIIYVFMDFKRILGVIISALNDGKRVNFNNYEWGFFIRFAKRSSR
jgi:hypothetical protein